MTNVLFCSYECKLCLTLHNNEGNYLAHTQGKRHQTNLAKRAAREAKDAPAQPQPHKRKVSVKKSGTHLHLFLCLYMYVFCYVSEVVFCPMYRRTFVVYELLLENCFTSHKFSYALADLYLSFCACVFVFCS